MMAGMVATEVSAAVVAPKVLTGRVEAAAVVGGAVVIRSGSQ